MSLSPDLPGYHDWLQSLKDEVHHARQAAARNVNAGMICLYWRIGREILDRQEEHGWGGRVVDRLSSDLRTEFPETKGFSVRNLKYMRKLAAEWPDFSIVQRIVAQLPWGQNVTLLDSVKGSDERLWYAQAAIENSWTRPILVHQIETQLHLRQGRSAHNFLRTIPGEQGAHVASLFKDPYVLDFVDVAADAHERHLERALIDKVRELLLEFGKGFSFIGNQYHLEVGGQDFYLDLLFYHTKLHRHVVVDIKMGDFEPEFVGKMGFYLGAVDDLLMTEGDNPSIGLILCRGKNGLIVEYALRDGNKPMAVSEYTMLPPRLAESLPGPEVWDEALGQVEDLHAEDETNEVGSIPESDPDPSKP